MMSNNEIIKQFQDKLEKNKHDLDHDSLWNKLEPRIKKQKRRPVIFWFYSCIFGIVAFFLYQNTATDEIKAIESSTKTPKTIEINNNKVLNFEAEKPIEKYTFHTESKEMSIVPSTSNKSPIHAVNIQGMQDKVKIKNEKIAYQSALVATPEIKAIEKRSNYIEEVTARQKWDTLKTIKHWISFLKSNPILLLDGVDFLTINEKQKKKFLYEVEFYTSYNIERNGRYATDYEHRLDDVLKAQMGYGFKINIGKNYGSHYRLNIGIKWDRMIEKHKSSSQSISYKEDTNEKAFSVNGNYLSALQISTHIHNTAILHYNFMESLSIAPSITYIFNQPQELSVSLFTDISFYQRYNGILLDEKNVAVSQGQIFDYRKRASINPGINVSQLCTIADKMKLSLNIGYMYQTNKLNIHSPFNKNNWHRLYVGLAYRW